MASLQSLELPLNAPPAVLLKLLYKRGAPVVGATVLCTAQDHTSGATECITTLPCYVK
jgi:hypothetical protein